MKKEESAAVLSLDGREVRVTNPEKLYFSKQIQLTKLDLVRYYLSVAPGALNGIRNRPIVLKRFVDGAEGEAFYQKRAPANHPAWLRTVTLNHWRNNRRRWQERLARDATIAPEELAAAADLEALWEEEYRKCLASRALTIMRSDFQEKTWKACWEVVVAGRSASDVAAALGLTVGAVYAAKFRVLDRLRQELRGMLD